MSSNEFVPTLAGIVMAVFGLALGAALIKGIVTSLRRRSWPVVEGTAHIEAGNDGRRNALARITYSDLEGRSHSFETPTGSLGSGVLSGRTVPLSLDPHDPDHAVPRSGAGNLAMFGCFSLICLFFAVFGIFTLVRVFTH